MDLRQAQDRADLSDGEREVLHGFELGLSCARISRELWLSEETVRFHMESIARKLGTPLQDLVPRERPADRLRFLDADLL